MQKQLRQNLDDREQGLLLTGNTKDRLRVR